MIWRVLLSIIIAILISGIAFGDNIQESGSNLVASAGNAAALWDFNSYSYTENENTFSDEEKSGLLGYLGSFFWNDLSEIIVEDGYAYCALTYGLMIFDVSKGLPFDTVSSLYIPTYYGRIGDLQKNGNILYFSRYGSVSVIDVTDIANPIILSSYPSRYHITRITYSDNLLFLAEDDSGFAIVDVTLPGKPKPMGNYSGMGRIIDICSRDGIALAVSQTMLYIFDIANPSNPQLTATYEASVMQSAILKDNIAYIALYQFWHDDWHNVMHILDLEDLYDPKLLATYMVSDNSADGNIILKDSIIYYGSDIIDASDPGEPHLVCQYRPSGCSGLDIYNSKIYVIYLPTSIYVYDMSLLGEFPEESNSIYIGRHELSQYSISIEGRNDIASDSIIFVSKTRRGIYSVSLSDLNTPQIIDSLYFYYSIRLFKVQDKILYAGNYIIDISDPIDMKIISQLSGPYSYYEVLDFYIDDNRAFLLVEGNHEGLYVYDIANPEMPVFLSFYEINTGLNHQVMVKDDIVYVTTLYGLYIIDYSDPVMPELISTYGFLPYTGIAISDTLAYLGGFDLEVLNISDPANPILVNTLIASYPSQPWAFFSNAMEMRQNYLYFAGDDYDFMMVDISDPLNPFVADIFRTPSNGPKDIYISGDLIYLADYYGLMVLGKKADDTRVRGDINADGSINISDAIYLINYVFADGSPPQPLERAELNCDGQISIADIVYLINHIFLGGDPPCNPNTD